MTIDPISDAQARELLLCAERFGPCQHDRECPAYYRPAVAQALSDLRAEVERLEKLVYVPGVWRCAKCNFRLISSHLNARNGTFTANNAPGEKCPNCDCSMWRVTERDAGNDPVLCICLHNAQNVRYYGENRGRGVAEQERGP